MDPPPFRRARCRLQWSCPHRGKAATARHWKASRRSRRSKNVYEVWRKIFGSDYLHNMLRLPKFRYLQPNSIDDAIRMIADNGPDAMFVAGGTDLYPNMKRRQQTPKTVISVTRLRELHEISGDGQSGIKIGAAVSLTEICGHPVINRDYPVVAQAARQISTPVLRNMGTIGGNLLLDT